MFALLIAFVVVGMLAGVFALARANSAAKMFRVPLGSEEPSVSVDNRAPATANWTPQTSGTTNILFSVHFVNDNEGWAVGFSNTILHTTDGGANWAAQTNQGSVPVSSYLGVRFVDANIGWAGGGSAVMRTTDGGATWAEQGATQDGRFRNNLFTVSATAAWIPTQNAVSSSRWFSRFTAGVGEENFNVLGGSSQYYDMYFTDPDNGWAVGTGPIVRITNGSSASPSFGFQTSCPCPTLNGIYMLDANTGWAVGNGGVILNTTNGGSTWTTQTSGTANNLRSVNFVDANTGWAVGAGGIILATTDGGGTWNPETSGVSVELRRVFFVNGSVGYAVGASGTILKREGVAPPTLGTYPDTTVQAGANTTVTPDAAPTSTTSMNVSTASAFKGTFAASPTTGVVQVTNAQPAGTYPVTVTAFNGVGVTTTKTFTLTVTTPATCNPVSFAAATNFVVGSTPVSVAVGDFNGDGQQDLASANAGSNNVSILLGTGTGSFGAATNFDAGSGPYSVAVGDFNGDGKQDLATANDVSGDVSILLGTGTGSFGAATNFVARSGSISVAVGDFNGDGHQDLATAATSSDSSHFVSVLLGTGTGSFGAATDFSVGYRPYSVVVGDFNGDGKQDLATANESSASLSVSILLGTGTGSFGVATNFGVGGDPVSVAVGDFNGDGKQDLATANYWYSNVSILLGTGTGSFVAATDVGVSGYPSSVTVGDFNRDGKQDLAVGIPGSSNVSILLGTGTGSFSAAINFGAGGGPNSVAVGDFNGDGKLDLTTANQGSSNLTVLLNTCTLNTGPTISAAGVTRQQGSPSANVTIANVNDLEDLETALAVTVNGGASATVNGVTVSGIGVSPAGVVAADVVADCPAPTATFTLRVTDTGGLFNEATLTVTVDPNTPPTVTYSSPQSVVFGGTLNVTPTTASDNGTVTGYSVQPGDGLTTAPTVDSSGVVSITNAQPAGSHTITIRATDNCAAFTDASFTLNVDAAPTPTPTPTPTPVSPALTSITVTPANPVVEVGQTRYFAATGAFGDGSTRLLNTQTLASGLSTPVGVAVDSTNIYWAEQASGTLKKMPLAGGAITTLASGLNEPTFIVVDGGFVYFSEDLSPYSIGKVPTVGGAVTTLVNVPPDLQWSRGAKDLAVDGSFVYWTERCCGGGKVRKVPVTGGMPTTLAQSVGAGNPIAVTFDADTVYFYDFSGGVRRGLLFSGTGETSSGAIYKVPKAGGSVTTIVSGLTNPSNLITDASNVYWAEQGHCCFPGRVKRVAKTGGAVATIVTLPTAPTTIAYDIVVDNLFMYLTDSGSSAVRKIPLDGSAPQLLSNALSSPALIAMDTGSIYWTESIANGSVRKIDKEGAVWSSSNTAVATVDAVGAAMSLAAGTTTITATSGSISGGTTLTVKTLTAIGVTPANSCLGASQSKQFTATGTFSDASTGTLMGDTWASLGAVPTARRGLAAAEVNGLVYAFGGREDVYGTTRPENQAYNPATNTWATKAPMVLPDVFLSGAAPGNGKIYAFGGFSNGNATREYDPIANVWTLRTPMPTARPLTAAAVLNGKIYVIGGGGPLNVVEEYNPATDTWTTKATMPTARRDLAAAAVNGKIYAIGGSPDCCGNGQLNVVEEYDPTTNTWTTKAPMPASLAGLSAAAANGKIYVFGGYNVTSTVNVFNTVYEYNPVADTWATKAPMPSARDEAAAVFASGKIYVVGGADSGRNARNPNEAYTLPEILWSSSNTAAATINEEGLASGLARGDTTITATSTTNSSISGSTSLHVAAAPTLVYSSPQSVAFGGALNVTPTSVGADGAVSYSVQSGHGLTTAPTVDASGVVSITNAQPAGAHTITIRATDNCGSFTDAGFTLNVGEMPTFAIDDVTQVETNSGTTSFVFTVTKTGSTALSSSVNFTTVDGSATTADNDYQANSGTLTFLPADTTKTITVLVNGDTTYEANEAFTVHLSGASGATISDADGTGTITNDDVAPPTLGNYPDTSVQAGANTTVTPDAAPTSTTSMNVSTSSTFRGTFAASPTTGVVYVTNAQPAGTYIVTVTAFNSAGVTTTKTFTLTVTNAAQCDYLSFSGASGSPFAAGTQPRSVAVGDFNGDGKQDLATSNYYSNDVTVLLGDGLGSFSPANDSPFQVGQYPESVAVGDFDGDGKLDLTTANWGSNNVTVLLGDGSAGFSPASGSPFAVGSYPWPVGVSDFNGDGKLDLVTANYGSNNVTVLLGAGNGAFSPATGSPFTVGSAPQAVGIGDFNGDGKLDLATGNSDSNNVTVLVGDGGGSFSSVSGSPFPVGSAPYSVVLGDFNSDGKQDLATANEASSNVTVLLGNGSGGFSPASGSPFTVGSSPRSVAVGDFNGDGKQDLTSANWNSTVTVLLGDGNGGFSPASSSPFAIGAQPFSLAVGDFNGDGKLDLTTANTVSNNVTVLLNTCTSNTAPTISAVGVTRQQGSPSANATIANVNDLEDPETALTVTVNGGASATVNGVFLSSIDVNAAGVVTADVAADCTATTATFTLRVTDTLGLFNEATVTVTVNPNTAPTLTYASPQSVVFGGALNVTPTSASDNGTITGYAVQSVVPALTTAPTVDSSGVVSITNAQPSGAHTITIRATDNCDAFTDAAFTLTVGAMPTFAVDDVAQVETNSGTTAFVFTVTKTGSTALNSSVNFTTVDGTATTANNDYQANSGTLTFLPVDTTKTITVLVNGDTTYETNEAFTVHLSNLVGATIADADGTGTITNDDSASTIVVSLPTKQDPPGGPSIIPITVGDTTGQGIAAYEFDISFNPSVLQPQATPFDATGTLSSGWSITPNTSMPGHLILNAFHTIDLTGQGVLLNLKFNVIGGGGSTSPLTWENFTFNEGIPGDTDVNGSFTAMPSISGHLNYQDSATGARNVTMTLTGTGGFVTRATTTDVNGDYTFAGVPAGNNYVVTPSRATEVHDLSITAFDASQAARFAALLITLSTNKQTAGDASNNGFVTAFDASQIARYQAQIAAPGSIAGSWKFTPASLSFTNLSADQTNQNLTAILVGDVSGNWTPAGPSMQSPSGVSIPVGLPNRQDPPGGPSTINITVGDLTNQNVFSYDFDMTFDPNVLQPQTTAFDATGTLSSSLSIIANTSTPGHVMINAFSSSTPMAGQGILLRLKFTVVGEEGSQTPLTWVSFNFNEGDPPDTTFNGLFTAIGPTAAPALVSGRITTPDGSPLGGVVMHLNGAATRTTISDSAGNYRFENVETGNLYTVTPALANFSFAPASRSFSLTGNMTDAGFTANPDAVQSANAIDTTEYFVRQQYLDFLGREPDQGGLDYWSYQINQCNGDAACISQKRIDVSAAFFASAEFQQTGSFIYRMYRGGLARQIGFAEFSTDRAQVVGGANLDEAKTAYAQAFVQRPEFVSRYEVNITAESFVDAVLQTVGAAGADLSAERDNLITAYNSGASMNESRALVLRTVADNATFTSVTYNPAFVLMEYFGYLRRDVDQGGYDFWLDVLNNGSPGNYRGMVCAFLTSIEYQERFSPIITRANAECAR